METPHHVCESSEESPAIKRPSRIETLNFPRAVVALLIVTKHYYRGPLQGHFIWNRMGVNFFFILHGFVVHFAKTNRRWPPPPPGDLQWLPKQRNLIRRFAAIYPVHFLGTILSMLVKVFYLGDAFHGRVLLAQLTFTEFVFPGLWNYDGYRYNEPLWFVSVMGWFWLIEEASYALMAGIWRTGYPVAVLTAVYSLWNLLAYIPLFIPGFPMVLYDTLPMRYFNQYWVGIMLAMIVQDRRYRNVPPTQWMATVGLIITACLYCIDPNVWGFDTLHLLKLNGWQSPLMAMIIWGLAEGEDPVAKACSKPCLGFYGDLAFPFFALQAPVWLVVKQPPKPFDALSYDVKFLLLFPILFGVAVLVRNYWQLPIRQRIEEWGKALPK